MLRLIKGPHLLKTWKIYEGESNLYCVGDFFSGGTLYDYLKEHGRLTEAHSISVMRQIIEALAYLETQGLIHRDIKPENILFTDKTLENAALVDFGFATRKEEFKKLFTRCGTPGWVAPEVLADQDYNTAVDVYSAGLIFYFLLTKSNPFKNKSYTKLIKSNKSGTVDYGVFDSLELEKKPLSNLFLIHQYSTCSNPCSIRTLPAGQEPRSC